MHRPAAAFYAAGPSALGSIAAAEASKVRSSMAGFATDASSLPPLKGSTRRVSTRQSLRSDGPGGAGLRGAGADMEYGASGCNVHEIEMLKRQVARLTQLRRDRDTYIQEIDGNLPGSEHSSHWDRRSSAVGMEKQHEAELGELRKALRKESDQRQAQKLAELNFQHRREMESLKEGIGEMHQQLLLGLRAWRQDGRAPKDHQLPVGDDGIAFGSSLQRFFLRAPSQQAHEPEPEEGNTSFEHDEDSQDMANRSQSEEVKLALETCRTAVCEVAASIGRVDLGAAAEARAKRRSPSSSLGHVLAELQSKASLARSMSEWREVVVASREAQRHQQLEADFMRKFSRLRQQLEAFGSFFSFHRSERALQALLTVWRAKAQLSGVRSSYENARSLLIRRQCLIDEAAKMQLIVKLWAVAAAASSEERRHSIELLAVARLRKCDVLRSLEVAAAQLQYLTLRMWASVVSEELQSNVMLIAARLRAAVSRVVSAELRRTLAVALLSWVAALRERKRDIAQRRRLIDLEAASSSELYRFKAEAKRNSLDLRKQRRAHGVAAVHANLDRKMQGVIHAWSVLARESQREGIYQRQLDIAAAESAAGCAVLRMEGRRAQLDLRMKWRALGLRAVEAVRSQGRRLALRAWKLAVELSRQEDMHVRQLGTSVAQLAATVARRQRRAAAGADAKARLCSRIARRRSEQVMFQGWASAVLSSRHAAELRACSRNWVEVTAGLQEAFMNTQLCRNVMATWKEAAQSSQKVPLETPGFES